MAKKLTQAKTMFLDEWEDGWLAGWVDGWKEVKDILTIADTNFKYANLFNKLLIV